MNDVLYCPCPRSAVELRLTGLIGTASHPDMQKKSTNGYCRLHIYYLYHTIITPTKCTALLLKAPDITICTLCLIFCPYMFQPA
jgi:hypothetical protein